MRLLRVRNSGLRARAQIQHTTSRVSLLSQLFCVPLRDFQRTSLQILRNPLVKQLQEDVWKRNCQVTSSKPSVKGGRGIPSQQNPPAPALQLLHHTRRPPQQHRSRSTGRSRRGAEDFPTSAVPGEQLLMHEQAARQHHQLEAEEAWSNVPFHKEHWALGSFPAPHRCVTSRGMGFSSEMCQHCW